MRLVVPLRRINAAALRHGSVTLLLIALFGLGFYTPLASAQIGDQGVPTADGGGTSETYVGRYHPSWECPTDPTLSSEAASLKDTLTEETTGIVSPIIVDDTFFDKYGGRLGLFAKRVEVTGDWQVGPDGKSYFVVSDLKLATGESLGKIALPTNYRQLVIMAKFSDVAAEPTQADYFLRLLNGPATPNIDNYYRESSYELLNTANSVVAGNSWYTLPGPKSDYYDPSGAGLNFNKVFNDAVAQVDPYVHFPDFESIDVVLNDFAGSFANGSRRSMSRDGVTKSYGSIVFPRGTWGDMSTWAHEIGHTLGFPHSTTQYLNPNNNRVYGNPYDIQSSGAGCDPPIPSYGCYPLHTITHHKANLRDWVAVDRKYVATPNSQQVLTIERLALPGSSGYLMAQIPIGTTTTTFYTVEARKFIGYDAQLIGEGIIIHRVNTNVYADASLIDGDGNGDVYDLGSRWAPGETFCDQQNRISVEVLSATSTAYSVRISTGSMAVCSVPSSDFALNYSGANYVRAADSVTLSPTDDITVEAWIRPTQLGLNQAVVSKRGSGTAANPLYGGYELAVTSQNRIAFRTYNNSGGLRGEILTPVSPPHPLSLNAWHHISGSYNRSAKTMRITLNGDLWQQTFATDVNSRDGDTSLNVGRSGTRSSYFKGRVDEVRISSVVRYTSTGFTPPTQATVDGSTLAMYRSNEGEGTTTADVASGNTATLSALTGSIPSWTPGVTAVGKQDGALVRKTFRYEELLSVTRERRKVGRHL